LQQIRLVGKAGNTGRGRPYNPRQCYIDNGKREDANLLGKWLHESFIVTYTTVFRII
jgi:hypothetical protein